MGAQSLTDWTPWSRWEKRRRHFKLQVNASPAVVDIQQRSTVLSLFCHHSGVDNKAAERVVQGWRMRSCCEHTRSGKRWSNICYRCSRHDCRNNMLFARSIDVTIVWLILALWSIKTARLPQLCYVQTSVSHTYHNVLTLKEIPCKWKADFDVIKNILEWMAIIWGWRTGNKAWKGRETIDWQHDFTSRKWHVHLMILGGEVHGQGTSKVLQGH